MLLETNMVVLCYRKQRIAKEVVAHLHMDVDVACTVLATRFAADLLTLLKQDQPGSTNPIPHDAWCKQGLFSCVDKRSTSVEIDPQHFSKMWLG